MRVVFKDLQQSNNPLDGRLLESASAVIEAIRLLGGRKPFLFELRGDNGFMLTVGFAGHLGSVQYSRSDGSPPYLMAVSDADGDDSGFMEFLAGDTPTPIPRRFCLPIKVIEKIASEFVEHGEKSGAVDWEEI